MLARPEMKTAQELGISQKQVDALIKVRDMLEKGELPWHRMPDFFSTRKFRTPKFNMEIWPDPKESHCGTIGCIGYWAEKLGGTVRGDNISPWHREYLSGKKHNLQELFFPDWSSDFVESVNYGKIKPEHAAIAIQNYLMTGKPDWAGVLKVA